MASTYSSLNRLELIASGEKSGTWGDITNTNWQLLETAVDGYVSVAMADANTTLSTANGSTDQARNKVVEVTGAHTAVRDLIIPAAEKVYIVKNSTTGGYAVTVKVSGQTGATVPNGESRLLFCDGTTTYSTGNFLNTSVTSATSSFSPTTTDTVALGTTTLMWSDLFLASGGVINWNNGDVTLTHSANTLAFAGASSGYTFTGGPVVPATNDAAALGTTSLMWSDLFLASGGVVNFNNGDVTITHSTNTLAFAGGSSGYTFDAAIRPASNDGAALGSTSTSWSDLFLASGAVINVANGAYTVTHSPGTLTFSGQIALGAPLAVSQGGTASTTPADFTQSALAGMPGMGATLASDDRVLIYDTSAGTYNSQTVSNFINQALNAYFGTTKGTLIYRDTSVWAGLAPP